MGIFRVAIVQHKSLRGNKEKNTEKAIEFIREAKLHQADIVLFPECFLTAYYAPDICRELKPVKEIEHHPEFVDWCERALEENDQPIQAIRKTAKEEQIGIAITAFTKGKKYPQNTAFIIDRNGNILLKYSKVHTCDFDWERYLEGGDAFHVCSFEGIRIGVMICYDREYPESARELMLQGAELVLVPNDCDSMAPRLQELSVHAMQNMFGIAMANPPGYNAGNSCAFHPMVWGEDGLAVDNKVIAADSKYDGILYADFDMEAIRKYREREDLGKNRKPRAYTHLI